LARIVSFLAGAAHVFGFQPLMAALVGTLTTKGRDMGYEVKCSKAEVREGLADYFREKADWRALNAERYPSDTRNTKSEKALRKLADYCMTLADDDEVLARLFALPHCWAEDGIFLEPIVDGIGESATLAKRYGFDCHDGPAAFFEAWVTTVESDYPEYVKGMCKYGDTDPTEEGID
jgi:hypothetical protein